MTHEELAAIKKDMLSYARANHLEGVATMIQECESALELYLALWMLDGSFEGAFRGPIGARLGKDARVRRAGEFDA